MLTKSPAVSVSGFKPSLVKNFLNRSKTARSQLTIGLPPFIAYGSTPKPTASSTAYAINSSSIFFSAVFAASTRSLAARPTLASKEPSVNLPHCLTELASVLYCVLVNKFLKPMCAPTSCKRTPSSSPLPMFSVIKNALLPSTKPLASSGTFLPYKSRIHSGAVSIDSITLTLGNWLGLNMLSRS